APLALLVVSEFRDRHLRQRECGVGAVEGGHRKPRDLGKAKIIRRWLLRSVDQLVAIDDLQDAAFVGAVSEIDAVARGASRDRPVQLGRHRAGRTRLLTGQTEVTDLYRMGGIGEI